MTWLEGIEICFRESSFIIKIKKKTRIALKKKLNDVCLFWFFFHSTKAKLTIEWQDQNFIAVCIVLMEQQQHGQQKKNFFNHKMDYYEIYSYK